jgi:hypothetical protein
VNVKREDSGNPDPRRTSIHQKTAPTKSQHNTRAEQDCHPWPSLTRRNLRFALRAALAFYAGSMTRVTDRSVVAWNERRPRMAEGLGAGLRTATSSRSRRRDGGDGATTSMRDPEPRWTCYCSAVGTA